jgi:hypothetical protein
MEVPMKEMNRIVDKAVYNDRMAKSALDKAFFLDKIDPGLIVDFGCADCALLKLINPWCHGMKLLGYDPVVKEMSDKDILEINSLGIEVTFEWDYVREAVDEAKKFGRKTAIVLSSVIHEVYHYGTPASIDEFWGMVFDTGFDFVVIRDMMPSRSIDRPACPDDVAKVYRKADPKFLSEFEACWGSVENNRSLIHWLLKYRYTSPSWDREVKENYMPLYREAMMAKIPEKYSVIYHEHYVLPYILRQVRSDFGIMIKDPTHLKMILEVA